MNYNPNQTDSFNDPGWGAETAKKQLAEGADVIFGAGGTTGTGALIAVAQEPGAGEAIFCIGIDVDQYETVPEARPCLLTSAEKKIAEGVADVVQRLIDGESVAGNVPGAVGLAPYHAAEDRVPEQVKQQVAQVVEQLSQGSLSTGVDF
jgi:basic membrane protein A